MSLEWFEMTHVIQADLLEQARKFSLESLFVFMDRVMSSNFPSQITSHLENPRIRLHNLVLRFECDLPMTRGKVKTNVVECLKNAGRQCSYCGKSRNQVSTYQVRNFNILSFSRRLVSSLVYSDPKETCAGERRRRES